MVEGQAGAGMVKATCSAKGDLKALNIDPSIFNSDDKEVVEDLRPLVYHFFKVNKQNKTSFMVHTYDKELKAAFDFGMSHFWFEKNPLVGEELNYYNDIACYKSTNPNTGYLFYRGVMRGTIDHTCCD